MDESRSRHVLITGAAGYLGRLITGPLRKHYHLTLSDISADSTPDGITIHFADVTDLPTLQSLCEGMDTVLHLAVQNYRAEWDAVSPVNILGVYNILKASADVGCRRVILPSSTQVMDGYPEGLSCKPGMRARPSNLYGASKEWAEAVGHVFAHTTDLSVLCLRIGWVVPFHSNSLNSRQPNLCRAITDRDLVALIQVSIEALETIKYGVFHGLSANRHKRLDIIETEQILGYKPRDDAFQLAHHNKLWRVRNWTGTAKRWVKRQLND